MAQHFMAIKLQIFHFQIRKVLFFFSKNIPDTDVSIKVFITHYTKNYCFDNFVVSCGLILKI